MKIWHLSDTHCLHDELKIPKVDMVIHSGDFSNSNNRAINSNEVVNFIDWFSELPIKYKILVAGNHDVSIENRLILPSNIRAKGIFYLENSEVEIEGIKIWGSPITPSFGNNWAWNMKRHKIHAVWEQIPLDTDIIITHGPPKGILDLNQDLEMCGCTSLLKVIKKINPIFSFFGHVHSNQNCDNSGIRKISSLRTMFSNGAVVKDGKKMLISNGNLLKL